MVSHPTENNVITTTSYYNLVMTLIHRSIADGSLTIHESENMTDDELFSIGHPILSQTPDELIHRLFDEIVAIIEPIMQQYNNTSGLWNIKFERGFVIGERRISATTGRELLAEISDGEESFMSKWLTEPNMSCNIYNIPDQNGFLLDLRNYHHEASIRITT